MEKVDSSDEDRVLVSQNLYVTGIRLEVNGKVKEIPFRTNYLMRKSSKEGVTLFRPYVTLHKTLLVDENNEKLAYVGFTSRVKLEHKCFNVSIKDQSVELQPILGKGKHADDWWKNNTITLTGFTTETAHYYK